MTRIAVLALTLASAMALGACSEKSQTATHRKADGHAFEGTVNSAYAAPGWKAGDAASWETQMKERAQGQNEYSRAAAK